MKFRVAIRGTRAHVWVHVHPNLKTLRAQHWDGPNTRPDAFFRNPSTKLDIDGFGNVTNQKGMRGFVGDLHFSRNRISPGIIAHECWHAACWCMKLRATSLNLWGPQLTDAEEWIAEIIQLLTDRIWERVNQ